MKNYKFCFDLDGTICSIKKNNETYQDVVPLEGAVETLKKLKELGHYIIIYTARNMLTQNNNLGRIIANQGPILIEWLKKYEIPYDELIFGKPLADFYIDDKGQNFTSWDKINNEIINKL